MCFDGDISFFNEYSLILAIGLSFFTEVRHSPPPTNRCCWKLNCYVLVLWCYFFSVLLVSCDSGDASRALRSCLLFWRIAIRFEKAATKYSSSSATFNALYTRWDENAVWLERSRCCFTRESIWSEVQYFWFSETILIRKDSLEDELHGIYRRASTSIIVSLCNAMLNISSWCKLCISVSNLFLIAWLTISFLCSIF